METLKKLFQGILGLFSGLRFGIGVSADQQALYIQDMYKAEREGYKEVETKHDKIFKVEKANKAAGDKTTQILGAGQLQRHEAEGQPINYKSPVSGWEYLVKYHTFSDGISLSKEAVEDTTKLGNLLKDLANTWGQSVRVEKEILAARVFNNGGALSGDFVFNGTHVGNSDPSGNLCFDGKPLFNLSGNTRTTKGGGTYYTAGAITLSLTAANFETVYNLMTATNNRDERDRVMSNPADTILVRPGSERFKADRIVDTTRGLPGGELNDKNPYYKIVSVIDWDYLTDGTTYPAFYVGKRQHPQFIWRDRQMPEIRFFRDEDNLGYKASINVRFAPWVKNWRAWTRGGGTSS